jgi:hypothetical protein
MKMKKLILLFICLSAFFSCKKDSNKELTSNQWVLETAVVTPALTVNNVTSTDYKNIFGSGSCLASNYTLVFNADGSYGFGSNGALCDMLASSKEDTWTQDGSTIVLKDRRGRETILTINNKAITYTETLSVGTPATSHTVLYTFKAK